MYVCMGDGIVVVPLRYVLYVEPLLHVECLCGMYVRSGRAL